VRTRRQTDGQTKVKTVYRPVSLRSLGGYKNARVTNWLAVLIENELGKLPVGVECA